MDNKEKLKEFEDVVRPVIKWLCENHHPHHTVVITCDRAELSEGKMSVRITEYIQD